MSSTAKPPRKAKIPSMTARVHYGNRGISCKPVDPDQPLDIGAQLTNLEMAEAWRVFVEQMEKTKAAASLTGTFSVR
jgi:hypothetical protein